MPKRASQPDDEQPITITALMFLSNIARMIWETGVLAVTQYGSGVIRFRARMSLSRTTRCNSLVESDVSMLSLRSQGSLILVNRAIFLRRRRGDLRKD